ncbi:MAG: ankyrin repeat domain-containing protein [Blastocatellia bacterium]|nr:ankyrin repeat domain-containing protein [Blastocatellia bacterium]
MKIDFVVFWFLALVFLRGTGVFAQVPPVNPLASIQQSQPVNAVVGDISFHARFGVLPHSKTDENLRIKTHLAYIEGILRQKTPAGLSPQQLTQRQVNLDHLHAYWQRGVFPHVFEPSTNRRPCFIDREGNLCAVGHLIAATAGRELAEAVNTRYQYALLGDMHLPELDQWVAQSGLSPLELAMIQPQYGPRHLFPQSPFDQAVFAGDLRTVKNHLATGAKINQPDARNGFTPLFWAVLGNRVEMVQFLLSSGVPAEQVARAGATDEKSEDDQITPLMLALEKGNITIVQALLKAGANAIAVGPVEQTPLFFAVESENRDARPALVELLLNHKADVNHKGWAGETPLHRAMYRSSPQVIRLLLKAGANPNAQSTSGWTPIMGAVLGDRDLGSVKALTEAGVNLELTNSDGDTVLLLLARDCGLCESIPLLEQLLAAGAKVNAQDRSGQTPLMIVSQRRDIHDLEFLQKLLAAHADVNLADKKGFTALMYAASLGGNHNDRLEIFTTLLTAGANVDVLDYSGWKNLVLTGRHPNEKEFEKLLPKLPENEKALFLEQRRKADKEEALLFELLQKAGVHP